MKKSLQFLIVFSLSVFFCGVSHAGAKYLECGKAYWYHAPTKNHYDHSNYHSSGCATGHHYFAGEDQMFYFDVHEYSDVTIELYGFHKDLDLLCFKSFEPWGYGSKFSDCKGASMKHGLTPEKIELKNAYGRYYLNVETYKKGWSSSYDIKITCKKRPKPQSCDDYSVIRCGEWKQFNYAYHHGKVSDKVDHHPSCSGHYGHTSYKGPEMIYRIDNSWGNLKNATIDFHSLDHKYEYDVFVYKWCKSVWDPWTHKWKTEFSGLVNSCHTGGRYGGHDKSIYIDHVGWGQDLYVVIERKSSGYGGWDTGFGNFKLAVTCGDVCDQHMEPMECGKKKHGSTKGMKNRASYYWQSNSAYSGHNWGPEKTYKFDVHHKGDYEIDLHVKSHADLNLYLMKGCHAKKCIKSSTKHGKGHHEKIKHHLHPGSYYVVVEGYHGDQGDYDLEIKGCNDCHNVKQLWCDTPLHDNNAGAHDDISKLGKECFSSAVWLKGPDKTYSFKAPKTGYYEFHLTGLKKDLDLFILDKCGKEAKCKAFSTKVGTHSEKIRKHLNKHDKVFVHVDSKSHHVVSSYKLKVLCDVHEPDPEPDPDPYPDPDPDPDPTPDPEPTCAEFSESDGVISIDLTDADLLTCDDAEVSVTVTPRDEDGNLIPEDAVSLMIDGDVLTHDVSDNNDGTDYQVCYVEACGDEEQSCCKNFYFEGTLGCGVTVSGTTRHQGNDFGSNDIDECYSSSSSFNGPDVLVPFSKAADDDVLQITMFQKTGNLSLFILDENKEPVNAGCKGDNFNETKDINNSHAVGEYWTDSDDPLPAGDYFALLDGFSAYVISDYTLNIACGLDCSDATEIACGSSIDGSTVDGTNNQSAYHIAESLKVGYTGGENVYSLSIDSAQEVTISLSDISGEGGADLDLFLLDGDCDAYSVVGQSISDADTDESITMDLDSGHYYVVVDGWRASGATYTLGVDGCTADTSGFTDNFAVSRSAAKSEIAGITAVTAYPNPFSTQLQLEINASNDTQGQVSISAIDGRAIYRQQISLNKGRNVIALGENELGSYNGLMYYQVQTQEATLQGKVLRIQ